MPQHKSAAKRVKTSAKATVRNRAVIGGLTTLLPALVGDFFGRLHAGSITGFLFAGAGILGAWGPMIAGYLRDVSGSYKPAFLYSALTGGVALLFLLLTPRPTVPRSPGISYTQTA